MSTRRGPGVRDSLVWLGAYRANRAAAPVRLVQFTLGATQYQYLTNVTDPHIFPLHQIARLYQRRWDIECAFQLVKEHVGLRLLWSAKQEVILQQVWGVLSIAQVLQALRYDIACRAGVDLWAVSLPLLVQHVPQYLAEGSDPIAVFVHEGRGLHFIRPSRRSENRAPVIFASQITPAPPALLQQRRTPRYPEQARALRPRRTLRHRTPPRTPAHAPD